MAWVQTSYPFAGNVTAGNEFQTISTIFEGNTTPGNCLVACVTWSTAVGQGTPISVTDSQGNTWTKVGNTNAVNTNASQACGIWVSFNTIGGSATTVTCTFSATGASQAIIAAEYSNVGSIDTYKTGASTGTASQFTVGTTNSAQTGSMSTTSNGDTIIACFVNGNAEDDFSPGTSPNFVKRGSTCFDYTTNVLHVPPTLMIEDYTQASAGSINPSATVAGGTYGHTGSGWDFTSMAVALKPAVVGGTETRSSGLIASYTTDYQTLGATQTLNITTQPGDYVVVFGGGENSGVTLSTPTGNAISWTLHQSVVAASNATAYIWSGTDNTGGTWTLSCTASASGNYWGFSCLVFRNVTGTGTSGKVNSTAYPAVLDMNTTSANSSIVVFIADYNATLGGSATDYSRWWAGVSGAVPTAGNGSEIAFARVTNAYTVYAGLYQNVDKKDLKTVGVKFPEGIQYSLVALEVPAPVITTGLYWFRPTLGGTIDFTEGFEGAAKGTSITSANNLTNFSSVTSTTSGTGVLDATTAAFNAQSLKIVSNGTTGNQYYLERTHPVLTPQTYMRFAVYLPSLPSSALFLAGSNTVSTESTTTDQANLIISSAGKIQLYDSGASTSAFGSVTVPIGKWFCIEWKIDVSTGQQTAKFYNDAFGTTLQETITAASSYGGSAATSFKIGNITSSQTNTPLNYTHWIDAIAISKTDWVGPL